MCGGNCDLRFVVAIWGNVERQGDSVTTLSFFYFSNPKCKSRPRNGGGAGGVYYPNPGGHSGVGGGSGPGGVSVSPPETSYEPWEDDTYNNREIRDSLDNYPCANSVLAYMKQSRTKICTLFNKKFGGTQTLINISFVPRTFTDPSYDGGKLAGISIYDPKIALSTNMLKNLTKEYILVTMYHEFWHAYLDIEKYK